MEQVNTVPTHDLELVHRAQAGDTSAFEALYRTHVGRVYAVCIRMVADSTRATELTQDTFVKAWQGLASFRGDSAFSSWLHRVAVNVVLGSLRAQRRREAHIQETDDWTSLEQADPHIPSGTRMDLEQAIAMLPPQARHVLVLHDLEGYRHREIGMMLGIAVGTSKAHLHRARTLLKRLLNR